MEQPEAELLSRAGNIAVVQLSGRAFPGINLQADTFANLHRQLAESARALRREPGSNEALDELDDAINEMRTMLDYYEHILTERGLRRPY